jgi:hypothetical protein
LRIVQLVLAAKSKGAGYCMNGFYLDGISSLIRKCGLLSLVFIAGCTHTTGEIDLVMTPAISQKVVEEKIGINVDKWRFEIGAAVSDLLPKALRTEYAKVGLVSSVATNVASGKVKAAAPRLSIKAIDLDLSAGTTVFSSHEVTLIMEVEYLDGKGKSVFAKKIVSTGSESGADRLATWGGFLETSKFTQGMNEALDGAVTNSVLMAAKRIVECIKLNGACS